MDIEKLKQKILDLAIKGKLVPQDPNDEPASVLIEKIREEKTKLVKEGKIKVSKEESYIYKGSDNCYYEKTGSNLIDISEEIPFEIPNNWTWCRLKQICIVKNGATPRRDNKAFWTNGTVPWFTIDDKHDQGLFINKTRQHITEIALSKDRIVPANSILLCCTASVGEVAYTNIDITTNQQFNGLTIRNEYKESILPLYLLIFASTLKKTLRTDLATATTFGFVSVSKVESIFIPIPPLAEQRRLIEKYNIVTNHIEVIEKSYTSLRKMVDVAKHKILEDIFGQNSSYKSYYEKEYTLGDVLPYEQPWPYIVGSTDYNDSYPTPVLTPGKSFILGYTNETNGIYKASNDKVIIFDDFTTASRLVDFDFKVKSSAMKILKSSDNEKFDVEYLYYYLQTIDVINDTHKRYWISEYAPIKIRIHSYEEQILIVEHINKCFNILDSIL